VPNPPGTRKIAGLEPKQVTFGSFEMTEGHRRTPLASVTGRFLNRAVLLWRPGDRSEGLVSTLRP
jgi:hypothetical protein